MSDYTEIFEQINRSLARAQEIVRELPPLYSEIQAKIRDQERLEEEARLARTIPCGVCEGGI